MPYELRFTAAFIADYSKLDKSIQMLADKKLERIKENPALSKPLEHASKTFSERVKNFRIIFQVKNSAVYLLRVRGRKKAYG